jgi:hypothetical protein
MNTIETTVVESNAMSDFVRCMQAGTAATRCPDPQAKPGRRLNLDADKVKNGLAQLVLTLIKLLHELLERQALRRIDSGSLRDDEVERLGVTLMQQAQEIEKMRKSFGLEEEDLNLDLGPLGKLL